MTQKQEILELLLKISPRGLTSERVFNRVNIERFPSVRGRLSELKKEGKIQSRKSKFFKRLEYFVPEKEYRRKIVKTTIYDVKKPHRKGAPSKKKFALTYESNKTNREEELLNSLSIPDKNFYEFGYDDELVTKKPPHVYPHIEVGFE